MALFISERIRKREFGKSISAGERQALIDGARVALAAEIAASNLPSGTKLLKAYATTRAGPRRIVYLLIVQNADMYVLFYRDKNDELGANISKRNPAFLAALEKYRVLLAEDNEAGRIEEIVADDGGEL